MARTRTWAVSVLVTGAMLAAAACSPTESAPTDPSTVSDATRAPSAELTPYYRQHLDWAACGAGAQCADVEVPLDYDNPTAERIRLAVRRVPAPEGGARIGSLVLNFGGPGGSAVDRVEGFAADIATPALRAAYDIVGFDPRGVGESSPVECVDDQTLDEVRAARYPTDDAEVARYAADLADLAAACARNTGPLLSEVDTVSAARDLDVLRAVLDDARLHYLGYSYGSFLGATYAELFPNRAGRLVLDGAVDPTVTFAEYTSAHAEGFERAIRVYADACLADPSCPLTGDTDTALGQVRALLERTGTAPLSAEDGRQLTPVLAATGILVALYDDRLWPALTDALTSALANHDGTLLLFLADAVAGRQPDGSYTGNVLEAQAAIDCLDFSMDSDPAAIAATAAELRELSPTFGPWLGYGELRCQAWLHEPTGSREPIRAAGAAPILVVGTTGDPATPYSWAQALAGQLESGRLLTWVGEGHTAYGRANPCLHEAVDAYLLDGTLPAEGSTC